MGFENFFRSKKEPLPAKSEVSDENESGVLSRRKFLLGSGALIGASMLNLHESHAAGSEKLSRLVSIEDREKNIQAIRAYGQHLKDKSAELAQARLVEAREILFPAPAIEQHLLKGTELDHDAFFRRGGSWPSVQVRFDEADIEPNLRFAHQPNIEMGKAPGYGNSFFADGVFLTNDHVVEGKIFCEQLDNSADIVGCSTRELLENKPIPKTFAALETTQEDIDRIGLDWDRRKSDEDLHGEIAFITSIHELRNKVRDNTDITPGVLVKVTPNLIWSLENPSGLINPLDNNNVSHEEKIKRSYMCIIAPRDVNGDNIKDGKDVQGISGSPVFTDTDCREGRQIPSGIAWGTITIDDPLRNVTYSIAFIHGPDVVGEMIDTVNTVVSANMDEEKFPQKKALTQKVQEALQSYGHDIEADGVYGGGTEAAVALFQETVFSKEELESKVIVGTVDRRTWETLFLSDEVNKTELYAALEN